LVFLDESGFQLTPVVRRTYAPRGKTPIVEAWHRKGRISAISAVTVSPVRRRPNLYFRLLPDNTNAHGRDTTAFLAQLRGELRGPMTILWDQSKIHERSSVVKAYLAKHPGIVTEDFPGYAPEANPDEGVWGWTKYHRLPNFAPEDLGELRSRLVRELSSLGRRRDLLASFIRHAKIPLRL
jgi:transposase